MDHFGSDTLRIISEESARLREIEGIGKLRVKSIKEAWEEQKTVREVMMFLQTYGVTDALCLRLVRKYGNSAKIILETEPYRIIREVKGIGFKTADKIALNLGLASNGPAVSMPAFSTPYRNPKMKGTPTTNGGFSPLGLPSYWTLKPKMWKTALIL